MAKQDYTRDELKTIGKQLLQYQEYDLSDPDKPFRVTKTMADADVYAALVAACELAVASDMNGNGISDAPQDVLAFLGSEGLLGEFPEEALPEEADEEEDAASDEDEGETAEAEDESDGVESASAAVAEAEVDPLDAELSRLEQGDDFGSVEPLPPAQDEQSAEDEGADKVRALLAEQSPPSEPEFAPIVAQNIEAAVLTMVKVLAAGKALVIAALEIDELERFLAKPRAISPPPCAAPACADTAKTKAVPLPDTVETLSSDALARRLRGENGDLKTHGARVSFVVRHNITLPKRCGGVANAVSDRRLAQLILEWAEAVTKKTARADRKNK